MRNIIIVAIVLLWGVSINAIENKKIKLQEARTALLNDSVQYSFKIYKEIIDNELQECNLGKGVDGDIVAEYAYALAVKKVYDGALINIDRARLLNAKYANFYTGQILALMNYPDLAESFMRDANVPSWINDDNRNYKQILEYRRSSPAINQDSINVAFKRANKLFVNGQQIQALVLIQEVIDIYPNYYVTYVFASTMWENLMYYDKAEEYLSKGIECMKSDEVDKTPFASHLTELQEQNTKYQNRSTIRKLIDKYNPNLLVYAGGNIAESMYSINGRIGFYTNNMVSATVNIGLSKISGNAYGNIGVSMYKTLGLFMVGAGITDTFGGGNNNLNFSPSAGVSFMNKSRTLSYDIIGNINIPFSSGAKISYGLSLGVTKYFNANLGR
ncbi:MAG: hypothetical protein IJN66_08660 [Muribaculaceae bacterium]|nr:hypothetical protein [Muribaculaceae bacterium]